MIAKMEGLLLIHYQGYVSFQLSVFIKVIYFIKEIVIENSIGTIEC